MATVHRTIRVTDETMLRELLDDAACGPVIFERDGERFAETRALLRRHGELIADFDLPIAATALHHDPTLLTFNLRHFARIPDLKLFHPG